MRKSAAILLTTALFAFGLVAETSGPAQALDCPYPGCHETSTSVVGPAEAPAGTRPAFSVTVVVPGSNVAVEGTVELTFTRPQTGRTDHGRSVTAEYNGETITMQPKGKLGRHVWIVTARFSSEDGTFLPSQDMTTIEMTKRGGR